MNQWLAIVRLDLALFLRDRKALILLYVVPVIMAAFFGQLTGGRGGKAERSAIPLAIVDQDNSPASQGIVSAFRDDSTFQLAETTEATAREWVTSGKYVAGVILPAGFGTNLLKGFFRTKDRPELNLIFDPSHETERMIVEGMLIPKIVSGVGGSLMNAKTGRELITRGRTNLLQAKEIPEEQKRLLLDSLANLEESLDTRANATSTNASSGPLKLALPYEVRSQPLTRSKGAGYNGFSHSFSGMSLQFVLMVMIDLAIGLLTERQSGTFRRLRAAPLSRGTLLLGKATSYSLIALSTFLFSFAVAFAAFGVRIEGSWIGFAAVLGSTCLFSAAMALALSSVGKTPRATRSLAIPIILILLMLGGAWIPPFIFPPWIQTLSRMIPTGWAMNGFDAMTWRGLNASAVLIPVTSLIGTTAILAWIAWKRFRWDGE
jgi:ABC-2 type transport system permease protein